MRTSKAHWNYLLDKRDSACQKAEDAGVDATQALATLLASGNACRVLRQAHANKLVERAIKLYVDSLFIKAVLDNERLLHLAEEGPDV